MARLAGRLLAFGGDADFFSDYQDSELQNGKCLTQIKFLQQFPFKFYFILHLQLYQDTETGPLDNLTDSIEEWDPVEEK